MLCSGLESTEIYGNVETSWVKLKFISTLLYLFMNMNKFDKLLTVSLQKTHIYIFPDYFSFTHFLAFSSYF